LVVGCIRKEGVSVDAAGDKEGDHGDNDWNNKIVIFMIIF
jgi:hypothetical protein